MDSTNRSIVGCHLRLQIRNQLEQNPFSFIGSTISLRRSDGSVVTMLVPPFASSLLRYVMQSKWDQAIRLCRQVDVRSFHGLLPADRTSNQPAEFQNTTIWAVLAGLSTSAKHLYTSEIAYGALEEVRFRGTVGLPGTISWLLHFRLKRQRCWLKHDVKPTEMSPLRRRH